MDSEVIHDAINRRNTSWKSIKIPKWVNTEEVGLDQYYTEKSTALYCYNFAIDYLKSEGLAPEDCFFVEPSAGDGSFYDLLPTSGRVGIDICPARSDIVQSDFLTWDYAFPKNKKIVYIGNPPFGYRGWLALQFMNKCGINADYVFFILPMSFQSMGKGSPRLRVKGLTLEHYERLPGDCYYMPDGKKEKINALWTVWKKGENTSPIEKDVSNHLELFTVDMRKERLCGVEKMNDASFFLQRTFYESHPPKAVESFEEVKYVCGYGFIIKKNEDIIREIINNTNWLKYSNLAAHNCHHISMYHIKQALYDGGLNGM